MTSKNVLPEDVVIDILLKLAVKSLLTFRCVCKEWRRLLDSPYFVSKHLEYSRTNKTTCILLKRFNHMRYMNTFSFVSAETLDIVSPDINVPVSVGDFYGPVNGIVSLDCCNKILFCNPSTREFKAVPHCNYILPKSAFYILSEGFGFDEKSNDYKFVRIIQYSKPATIIQIYSLASDCWRYIDHLTLPNVSLKYSQNGYFNGACHWFAVYRNEFGFDEYKRRPPATIMSFRMDTEVFEEMPIPNHVCLANDVMWHTICVSSKEPKNLSLILSKYKADGIYEVWVMREYGVKESWIKQYTVDATHISTYALRPVCIGNDDELILCGWREFILYHLNTEKIGVRKAYETVITSAFYMESLVSVKSVCGAA